MSNSLETAPKALTFVQLLFVLPLFLSCTSYKNNNPVDPLYPGDYRLSVSLALSPDSLSVFREYGITCATGADTFSTYRLSTSPAGLAAVDGIRYSRPDSIFFHVTGPFDGMAYVAGVRPNGKTVTDSTHIHVVNPYRIVADTPAVAGEADTFKIERPSPDTPNAAAAVIWSAGGLRHSAKAFSADERQLKLSGNDN